MNYYKGENNKVYGFNDLQVKQGKADGFTSITESEKDELLTITLSGEEQSLKDSTEAQSYMGSTDWVNSKYVEVVLKNKTLTDEEYSAKYADIYEAREISRKVISDYKDNYLS